MKWSTLYNDIRTNTQTGDFKKLRSLIQSLPVWHFRVHFKCAHSLVLNQGHVRGVHDTKLLFLFLLFKSAIQRICTTNQV